MCSYGLCSHGLCRYGLHSYDLYNYGLNKVLGEMQEDYGDELEIDEQEVHTISQYEPDVFGLDVPELLLRVLGHTYIGHNCISHICRP